MKKEEANEISKKRVSLIMEYIEQFLSEEKIKSTLRFCSKKIENQSMLVLDINVIPGNFERHLNLGITSNHSDVLYEQLFSEIIGKYLESESVVLLPYQYIHYFMGEDFSGITINANNGSEIKFDFKCIGNKFNEITDNYDARLFLKKEYEENRKNVLK